MARLGLGEARVPVKTAGDRFAEFFLQLAMLSATLGKIGQNIYNLQVTDVDEVTEFVEGKVGSSAMPHKLNPVASGSLVLLARLVRGHAGVILEYVHSEWEDDHRQGETSWAFPQEVCLLLGAQLTIGRRLLASLVVKPENMLRNLDRGGGVVLSEALMMALAPQLGRDSAHALVLRLHRESLKSSTPFAEAVRLDPDVRARLTPRQLAAALDYRNSLGLTGFFVDRVLAEWRRQGDLAAAASRGRRKRAGARGPGRGRRGAAPTAPVSGRRRAPRRQAATPPARGGGARRRGPSR
jgi:adenylosuccinate lyase